MILTVDVLFGLLNLSHIVEDLPAWRQEKVELSRVWCLVVGLIPIRAYSTYSR